MEYFTENIIDANSLSYKEWGDFMFSDKIVEIFPNNCFPNEKIQNEFVKNIKSISDNRIKFVIRKFLVHTGFYGSDKFYTKLMIENNTKSEIQEIIKTSEYYRRIFTKEPAWEGITWILDLLPSKPDEALKALDAYFIAHCILAPDYVISGLLDASLIINAKYIEYEHPQEIFLKMKPSDFELIVARLFKEKGYSIILTQQTRDGGIDIIANKTTVTEKEKIIIQCKRYKKKITVKEVRELNGTINDYPLHYQEKITKGVFVCSSGYTSAVKKEFKNNHAIELIDYKSLSKELNKYLGTDWVYKLNNILNEEKTKYT